MILGSIAVLFVKDVSAETAVTKGGSGGH
jgi:hypothetical protein